MVDRFNIGPIGDEQFNGAMAARFRRAAELLDHQKADRFRIRAYAAGASAMMALEEPSAAIYRRDGLPGLIAIPSIGIVLSLAIADVVDTGRWHWLERLEGTVDPEAVFASVAGIGPVLADRIHDELSIDCLEELERAANDGRLSRIEGFGPERIRAIQETLATRLRFRSQARSAIDGSRRAEPTAQELLDIDADYRRGARDAILPRIAPRRFNPTNEPWLPIMHTSRNGRSYTSMYSNTARAHQLGRTDDWVVIAAEAPFDGTWTVVTETQGPNMGKRVVRGHG